MILIFHKDTNIMTICLISHSDFRQVHVVTMRLSRISSQIRSYTGHETTSGHFFHPLPEEMSAFALMGNEIIRVDTGVVKSHDS